MGDRNTTGAGSADRPDRRAAVEHLDRATEMLALAISILARPDLRAAIAEGRAKYLLAGAVEESVSRDAYGAFAFANGAARDLADLQRAVDGD